MGKSMSDQLSFTDAECELQSRKTRKARFLERMDSLVPWQRLVDLIEPHYPKGQSGPKGGSRKPYPLETMLRIHCLQQWYNLSDPAMEDSLYDIDSFRRFAGLDRLGKIPDESTILKFRHLLEKHQLGRALFEQINAHLIDQGITLREGSVLDATIIEAPSSTKNQRGQRDPEMHQTKKGKDWHFGMKAHIGADVITGVVHDFVTTPANTHDITVVDELLHGDETLVIADAGYRGVDKREEHTDKTIDWGISARPGLVRQWRTKPRVHKRELQFQRMLSSFRAKVEHPFRVLKCQFGFRKTRYRGLAKNDNKLAVMLGLANLLRVEKQITA